MDQTLAGRDFYRYKWMVFEEGHQWQTAKAKVLVGCGLGWIGVEMGLWWLNKQVGIDGYIFFGLMSVFALMVMVVLGMTVREVLRKSGNKVGHFRVSKQGIEKNGKVWSFSKVDCEKLSQVIDAIDPGFISGLSRIRVPLNQGAVVLEFENRETQDRVVKALTHYCQLAS